MKKSQMKLIDFYEAVISDDGAEVEKILTDNFISLEKISIKMITGMLVIAIENKYINSGRAILQYNLHTREKITDRHLDAIMCMAAKNNLLAQLRATYH